MNPPGSAAIKGEAEAVVAPLTYTLKLPEKLVYDITEMGDDEDLPEYHKWYNKQEVVIENTRPRVSDLSLDREGFILRHAETSVGNFYDETEVRNTYDAEIEALVKESTGANKVLVFDHTIRVESDDLRRKRHVRETVDLVHNDYTVDSGPQRVRDLLSESDVGEHLNTRFAIYNVWRPIVGPVLSSPLAMCDAQSVKTEDWVACDLDYGDRRGEIYNVAYNADHRWCYFPEMTTDEILLFKNYDSIEDGRARFTPHTAFVDPTTPDDTPSRESIETRVLAWFTA